MRRLLILTTIGVVLYVLTIMNVKLSACSGEVEQEMTRSYPQTIKMPIDYQNTEKCKCCGGTGRVKLTSKSR